MLAMKPKKFDGKPETPFKAWAKSVRAYCKVSRPSFRKFLRWVESQATVIDYQVLTGFAWEHEEIAGEAFYEFLLLHAAGEAQLLVELQDEIGLESCRQLAIWFVSIGESYVLDQTSAHGRPAVQADRRAAGYHHEMGAQPTLLGREDRRSGSPGGLEINYIIQKVSHSCDATY